MLIVDPVTLAHRASQGGCEEQINLKTVRDVANCEEPFPFIDTDTCSCYVSAWKQRRKIQITASTHSYENI